MKMFAACVLLIMTTAAHAAEWKPTEAEINAVWMQAREEMLRATEPARLDDTCLTIELRTGFKNPDLPTGWCHTTADGKVYTTPVE